MKKYYVGTGYFHEEKWVNGINMPTKIPLPSDHIIIDNRCNEITIGFKNKFKRFIYNLKIAIRMRTFKWWSDGEVTVSNFTICTTGTVIIKRDLHITDKFDVLSYERGTVNVIK